MMRTTGVRSVTGYLKNKSEQVDSGEVTVGLIIHSETLTSLMSPNWFVLFSQVEYLGFV